MGVFEADAVGEYWADLRYAWCWYGASCGMAVAVENCVAMVGSGGFERERGVDREERWSRRVRDEGAVCDITRPMDESLLMRDTQRCESVSSTSKIGVK